MQDADVKALAWAVRRELDICLAELSKSSETEGWGPQLEQVRVRHRCRKCFIQHPPHTFYLYINSPVLQIAEVSGPDGFAYLIGKLLATWSEGLDSPEAFNHAILHVLSTVLSQHSLKLALVEGLKQSSLQTSQLEQLVAETALKPEQQLSFALTLCTSRQAPWKKTGVIQFWFAKWTGNGARPCASIP